MRLIQYQDRSGKRHVGSVMPSGDHARQLRDVTTVLELANLAIERGLGLEALATTLSSGGEEVDYAGLLRDNRVLAALDHPEPARFLVTGTGLTHLGSAKARDNMHTATHGDAAPESDSMKIFRMGLSGGKPGAGKIGVQPEWFFKGVGTCVVAPGATLPLPAFALAGGEEPEIVGLYLVDKAGNPRRIGHALGNDFSDHVTEGQNYLYLAHSKLRACSIGPELLIGDLPADIRGKSRVLRDGKIAWEEEMFLGEANMSHSIANLEHYHFRYPMFRRPGDLHAYFFGAAVLSYAAGFKTRPGDEFEIEAPVFGKPLRNPMVAMADEGSVTVEPL